MAFSPFRTFRKHQKAFFAVLTIVCMLTFVLAGSMSRGGDFFSWISSLIGGSREPKVAVLNGKPVYRAEILNLRNQRQLANQYMDLLTQQAQQNLRRSLLDASSKIEDSSRNEIQQLVNNWIWAGNFRKASEDVRRQHLKQLSGQIRSLGSIAERLQERKKESEAALLMEFRDQLQRDIIQIQGIKDKNELFFGGTLRFEDLIDFLIWKHEADRRGIQLTMADIRELVNRDTARKLTATDFRNVENFLRDHSRNIMNADTLRAGLADEFRVRIVKAAVMGEGASGVSTSVTPYEFWQFYRDQRTENVIAVLPIPVRNPDFLSQVGQPKEEELKTIFAEGKDRESDPASDKPGFKVPPRIGVEWVSARADSEHYRKAAEVVLAATQATLPFYYEGMLYQQYQEVNWNYRLPSWTDNYYFLLHDSSVNRPENVAALVGQLAAGGSQPMAFSGGMSYMGPATSREVQDRVRIGLTMALSRTSPTPFTSAALAYYGTPKTEYVPMTDLKEQLLEKVKEKTAHQLLTAGLGEFENELARLSNRKPQEVIESESVNRPDVVASMIGALTTNSTLGRPQFSTPILFGTPVVLRDVKLRSRLGAEMFLAGTQLNAYPLAAFVYQEQNRNVEAVKKLIDGAVAKYGLQHGFTRKLRTHFDIAEDEGLKPLKDSYDRFRSNHGNAPKDFTSLFWSTNPFMQLRAPYSPQQWPQVEIDVNSGDQKRIFQQFQVNQMFWNMADQPYLYWKTEDKPAYTPTFDEAKDKIIAWWKFEKARGLAEKEAEQVMKEAKGQPDAERRIKDGSKHSEKWFYLADQEGYDKVAKLVKPLRPNESSFSMPNWVPFRFSKSQIEYPPSDLLEKLIALKEPGEVLVFHDQPKATYYVAAVVEHRVPSTRLFYREYDLGPGPLLKELEETTHYRREFEKNLLAELRREARLEIIEENRDLVDQSTRTDEE